MKHSLEPVLVPTLCTVSLAVKHRKAQLIAQFAQLIAQFAQLIAQLHSW